jgi:hypothetical protein
MKKYRSDILPEYKDKIALLQKRKTAAGICAQRGATHYQRGVRRMSAARKNSSVFKATRKWQTCSSSTVAMSEMDVSPNSLYNER